MLPPKDKLRRDFPALAAVGSCLSPTPAPSSLTQNGCSREQGLPQTACYLQTPNHQCLLLHWSPDPPAHPPATPPSVTSHSPPLSHTRPPTSQKE